MSKFKIVAIVVAAILVFAVGAFLVWAYTPLGPMPEALLALESGDGVQVQSEPWLVFRPDGDARSAGLIFYPGGRVDPRSYAPAARAIAAAGFPVIIVPMPLNLAVTGINRADDVMAAFPDVAHWAIGGHSLGGAMAASYVYGKPEAVDGLVLWAAYPAGNNSLTAHSSLAVTSISGSLDGLATPDKIDASRPLLPAATIWVPIEGGNHAQFGWYGPQGGDNEATISREAQQVQIVAATIDLLEQIDSD